MRTIELKEIGKSLKLFQNAGKLVTILGNVLVKNQKGKLTFTVSTLEEFFTGSMISDCSKAFEVLVETSQLVKIIDFLEEEVFEVGLTQDHLIFSSGGLEYKLLMNGSDLIGDFPSVGVGGVSFKDFPKPEYISCSRVLLDEIVKRVGFCTAEKSRNASYSGMLFTPNLDDPEISDIVATDIWRLIQAKTGLFKVETPFVLPLTVAKNTLKIFKVFTGFEVFFTKNDDELPMSFIRVHNSSGTYYARLLRNEFPQYAQILSPIDKFPTGKVDRVELLHIIDKMAKLDKDAIVPVRFEVPQDGDTFLKLSSKSITGKVDWKGHGGFLVGVNANLLVDYLKISKQVEIDLGVSLSESCGPTVKPVFIKEKTGTLEIFYIQMPVKL